MMPKTIKLNTFPKYLEENKKWIYVIDKTPGNILDRFIRYQGMYILDYVDSKERSDFKQLRKKLVGCIGYDKVFCFHMHGVLVDLDDLFPKEFDDLFPRDMINEDVFRKSYQKLERKDELYGRYQEKGLFMGDEFGVMFYTTNDNLEKIPKEIVDSMEILIVE